VQKQSRFFPIFLLLVTLGFLRDGCTQRSLGATPNFREPEKPLDFPKPLTPRPAPLEIVPRQQQTPIQIQIPILKVKKFNYVGNTVFSNTQLDKLTSPYIGRELTPDDITAIQNILTDFYGKNGYTNSGAFIDTENNLSFNPGDATITIRIIEGGLESINIEGTTQLQTYIRRKLDIEISKPLNTSKLLNNLAFLQDDPLLTEISASIDPSTDPSLVNASVLKINAVPSNPYKVEAFIDNNGNTGSGSLRQGINFIAGNPLGQGDSINLTYARSEGTNALKATYSIPVTKSGNLRLSYFFGQNLITQSPFNSLEIRGTSQGYELAFEEVLYQKATESTKTEFGIRVGFRYDRVEESLLDIPFQISSGSTSNGITDTKLLFIDQYGSYRGKLQAAYFNSRFLGGVDLDSATDPLFKNGAFLGWRGEAAYTRLLPWGLSANAKLQFQAVTNPVVSSQQFVLSGQNSVRGIAENSSLGYNGFSGSLQLNKSLIRRKDGNLGVFAFLDGGSVWNGLKRSSFSQALVSVGGGVMANYKNLSADLTYGHPLTDGSDVQGNSLQSDGLTFTVKYRFY
jgi:hemolysin activation/secretion protein